MNRPKSGPAWTRAGHRLRPYLLTGGRTRPQHVLQRDSFLIARSGHGGRVFMPEIEQVLLLCSGAPRSVAELSEILDQPVQVAKILAADLVEAGALAVTDSTVHPPSDRHLLGAILAGLRRLE
ncbi:DUF742 domain-containing protein [Streptomyces sp. NPDC051776]|uniref:DUF742 domain-containing protein n=1 Tax=Streptomyces sp. NPDC051776 TaxID=3155414 RepID=UPI00342E20DB